MPPTTPRECRNDGCTTKVILARVCTRWTALEADARTGLQQAGCLVLVESTAWPLSQLVEHFMTTYEVPEPRARDLALDYPFHRPHRCDPNRAELADNSVRQ